MICSIIPARGGSKGIPRKNIIPLGGYPLIAYSIIASKLCKDIDRTIVSTDSREIAIIAKEYGAEVPFLRPAKFANDKSTDLEYILHAINWFKENEKSIPGMFVLLRPTTPFRDPLVISSAINIFKNRFKATSLRSAHPASESPFKWFIKDRKGYFNSFVPGYSNDFINNPRQSFPDVYIPDGYVDLLKPSFIVKSHMLFGNKMLGFLSPACFELDRIEDLEMLEFEFKKNRNTLIEYLKKNFPLER